MANFFQVKSYLNYWLDAVDDHSLQSPFFFDLYTNVIRKKPDTHSFEKIESLRKKLIEDTRMINRDTPGSESLAIKSNSARISDVARTSLSPQKFLSLYSRIIDHYRAVNIIELGTSFGISTLYLAQQSHARILTFEGSAEIADVARLTFEFAGANNITLVEGNIDTTLSRHISSIRMIDIAFIDANHRYEPTMRYFNSILSKVHARSVVIVDDIHYTGEMEKAWNEIKNHKLVYATADLYRCGLVFFDPSVNKQHVVLQF